jgi:hypothetical protein
MEAAERVADEFGLTGLTYREVYDDVYAAPLVTGNDL